MAHDFRKFSPEILGYISRLLRQNVIMARHGKATLLTMVGLKTEIGRGKGKGCPSKTFFPVTYFLHRLHFLIAHSV